MSEKQMPAKEGYIHSIDTCGTTDGPGVRYIIQLQGCPMRCSYCHTPDSWDVYTGTPMSVKEVLKDFYSNMPLYHSGGITVTGGEPMMQMEFLISLVTELKAHGVHTCIDTSGIMYQPRDPVFMEQMRTLLPLTDLVILDIKHMIPEKHIEMTGFTNQGILSFANYLDSVHMPVWIRHVIVPGVNFYQEYLEILGEFMATLHNIKALDVVPYHSLGKTKYEELNIEYPLMSTPEATNDDAAAARETILNSYQDTKTFQRLYPEG